MLRLRHLPIFLISLVLLVVIILVLNSCSSLSGYYQIDSSGHQKRTSTEEIKQFPDGPKVPEGYQYITTIEYKTGLVTLECDYHHMVSKAREAVLKIGGDAFRLNNVIRPDYITNTCYTGSVLVFKKKANM